MLLFLVIITLLLLFVILGCKNWFINYIKVLKTYGTIPCPPNRLPLLGNIFSLPLDPHRKKTNSNKSKKNKKH